VPKVSCMMPDVHYVVWGQPVAEVVISSAKRSDWDWLLHPRTQSMLPQRKSYRGLLFPRAFIVPETPTTNGVIGVPAASEIKVTAA